MRISPLGIFGANYPLETVAKWAMQDAQLTHPNPVCQQANALFAMAISHAIVSGCNNVTLYGQIKDWAVELQVEPSLLKTIEMASEAPPDDYIHQQGWVLIAFQNALWQLVNAESLEAAVVDTVMRGGDTDTNAAITGALLGAVYGLDAIPQQWKEKVLTCRPEAGKTNIHRPRPKILWPVDALELASKLIQ